MSYIDEAGGMAVKLALDGMSYTVRIAGQSASALTGAFIKLAAAGFEGLKSQDKEYIKGLLKSGEGIGLYSIPPDKEREVKKLLKEFKVPYVLAEGKNGDERMLMTGISNAAVIEHVFDKVGIVPTVEVKQKEARQARPEPEPERVVERDVEPDLAAQMWGEEEKMAEAPAPEAEKREQDRMEPEEGRSKNSSGSTRKKDTGKSPGARNEMPSSTSGDMSTASGTAKGEPGTSSQGPQEGTLSPFSAEAKEAAAREGRKPSLKKALNTLYTQRAKETNEAAREMKQALREAGTLAREGGKER